MAQCLSPFIVEHKIEGKIPVPCGKCYYCIMRKVSEWHFRLSFELKYADSATFLTLTYDDDHLSASEDGEPTLVKKDLQDFFKRLRYFQNKRSKNKIRYYAVGEYGSRFDRPHYHAILFNSNYDDVSSAWHNGSFRMDPVTDASIGYVTGYVRKSFYSSWDSSRTPPFACMSKYLGINYLSPAIYNWHKKDLQKRMFIPLSDGKKIAMPRYFKNLIYDADERKWISYYAEVRSGQLTVEREQWYKDKYPGRESEMQFEHIKALYKKLQLKKQKRKL